MYIRATTLNKILDSVIRILRNKKYLPKNPYKAYIKGKFIISPNYDAVKAYYTKFSNYISLDLFKPVLVNAYKYIKYLFTVLDIIIRSLNFHLLKIKIKSKVLNIFKEIKISTKNQSN